MKGRVDFGVYSPDDRLQLVVEVKGIKGATDGWAANMRRNLLVHEVIPNAPFFLLALPEYFYLWQHNTSTDPVPANYKVRAREVLRHYLDDTNLEQLSEQGFELLVSAWLHDLAHSQLTKEAAPELSWIFDSGLYGCIAGGSVAAEVPA